MNDKKVYRIKTTGGLFVKDASIFKLELNVFPEGSQAWYGGGNKFMMALERTCDALDKSFPDIGFFVVEDYGQFT